MKKESKKQGIVYVLSNPVFNCWKDGECVPLYKIGSTSRTDLNIRMKELYTTGVPCQFECEDAVFVDDCVNAEVTIHSILKDKRYISSREFFVCSLDIIKDCFKLIRMHSNKLPKDDENAVAVVNNELEKTITVEEKLEVKQKNILKNPGYNFYKMGLSDGNVLSYRKDRSITCAVCGENRVKYCGVTYTLNRMSVSICGDNGSLMYIWDDVKTGRQLIDLYKEMQLGQNTEC